MSFRNWRSPTVRKNMLALTAWTLVSFFGLNNFCRAQEASATSKSQDWAATRLEDVRIKAQGVANIFSTLSSYYDIPIGVEEALEDGGLTDHLIEVRKGTLSEFLAQFVARYDRYAWEIRDGVVNVFPKDNHRDLLISELLETNVGSFSIAEGTSCYHLVKSLADTPEIKKAVEANGTTLYGPSPGGFYIQQVGRHFKLDVSDMTLKSILNKVIKESPTAGFWRITRNHSDQAVYIGLSARHEDTPPGGMKPIVIQSLTECDEEW